MKKKYKFPAGILLFKKKKMSKELDERNFPQIVYKIINEFNYED